MRRPILQEIWSDGSIDLAFDELVAEDYVSHGPQIGEGRGHFKFDVTGFRESFPVANVIVVDRIVFDDNRAIILTYLAFPGDSLDALPPEAGIGGALIYQVENGQLSDRWNSAPYEP